MPMEEDVKQKENQPPIFGKSQDISAPLASCVHFRGTRASNTEFKSCDIRTSSNDISTHVQEYVLINLCD